MEKEIITDLEKLAVTSYEVDIKKENDLLKKIIIDLKDTLRAKGGAGLAAIQIGYNKRVFIINFNGKLTTFINPMIAKYKNPIWSIEECLSIPDKKYAVLAFDTIEVFYQTPLNESKAGRLNGVSARIFQHENNHLNGVTIADHGLEWSDELDKLSDEEKHALFIELAKQLEEKQKEKEKENVEDAGKSDDESKDKPRQN